MSCLTQRENLQLAPYSFDDNEVFQLVSSWDVFGDVFLNMWFSKIKLLI